MTASNSINVGTLKAAYWQVQSSRTGFVADEGDVEAGLKPAQYSDYQRIRKVSLSGETHLLPLVCAVASVALLVFLTIYYDADS